MALTRKFLAAMSIDEDKIEEIIAAHTDTTTALKEERDKWKEDAEKYKADAAKLPEVQKELDDLKADDSQNEFEQKYNELKAEYEKYKAEEEAKELTDKKTKAYRQILKDAGIADKRIDTVIKASPDKIEALEFDEEGKVKGAEELHEKLQDEWSDFIVRTSTQGAAPETPPTSTGAGGMSKAEILAIKNPHERHKAIAENMSLFSNEAATGTEKE